MASSSTKTATKVSRVTKMKGMPGRLIARTPWLRRRYARRIVRTIEKFNAKGRPLPDSLARLERQLKMVPEPKRAKTVEQIMEMSVEQEDATPSREMRRAAGRQDRHKGSKGGGLRPGTMPGQPRQRTR